MTRPAVGQSGNGAKHEVSAAAAADGKAETASRIKALYRIMQSVEGRLGGGEGVEGLYGSITCTGMQRIVAALQAHCRLGASSCLVDVGAGLGRPLLHAMLAAGLSASYGVEIDAIKCQKAAAFLVQTRAELARRGALPPWFTAVPEVSCSAIEQVRTLDPATHAYSFWEGVPGDGKRAFGRLVANSSLLQGVAVVQRAIRAQEPAEAMRDMGFGDLCLVDSFPVSMSGSGRSFRAYVFRRVPPTVALAAAPAVKQSVEAPAAAADELRAANQQPAAAAQLRTEAAEQALEQAKGAAAPATGASPSRRPARARAAAALVDSSADAAADRRAPQDAAADVTDAQPHDAADAGAADTAAVAAPSSGVTQAEPSAAAAVEGDGGDADSSAAADEVQSAHPAADRSPTKRPVATEPEESCPKCRKSPEKASPSRGRAQRPAAAPPPRQGTLWGQVRSRSRGGGRSAKAQLFAEAPKRLVVEAARQAPEAR